MALCAVWENGIQCPNEVGTFCRKHQPPDAPPKDPDPGHPPSGWLSKAAATANVLSIVNGINTLSQAVWPHIAPVLPYLPFHLRADQIEADARRLYAEMTESAAENLTLDEAANFIDKTAQLLRRYTDLLVEISTKTHLSQVDVGHMELLDRSGIKESPERYKVKKEKAAGMSQEQNKATSRT